MIKSTCSFASEEPMCKTLDKAGVPSDTHWRSLILYLRDISEHNHRPNDQKKEFQQLLLNQIKNKDYSEQQFKVLSDKTEQIISAPCLLNLKNAINETAKLLGEFQQQVSKRRGDIQMLQTTTISRVESGIEPQLLLNEIRSAFHDVLSEMDEDIENLHTLTHIDSLTDLHNRRSLDHYLKKEVARAKQQKSPLSAIFLDIDHFKKFNDDFGHRIGDQALATVASIIKQTVIHFHKKADITSFASRYGGEEFVIILPGCNESEATGCAEFIRAQLMNYNFIIRNKNGEISRKDINITASFGVAQMQDNFQEPQETALLDAADHAMYQAKKGGRNQVVAHSA